MKIPSKIYTALIFIFLYAPIVMMMFFSFNAGKSFVVFSGFSLRWYKTLFNDKNTLNALYNTLILAVTSSIVSTVLGTSAAVAISKMKKKYVRTTVMHVTNIPMMNAEIVTGISFLLLFVAIGRIINIEGILSFWTILIAHITFCLPYVILSVLPKIRQMDKHLSEAALDLGCTPLKAFLKVELPAIMPGVITGMIMAFTLSLDDFVISYFTAGNGFNTLPIRIFNMTKKTVTPDIYALSTLLFIAIFALLLIINWQSARSEKRLKQDI